MTIFFDYGIQQSPLVLFFNSPNSAAGCPWLETWGGMRRSSFGAGDRAYAFSKKEGRMKKSLFFDKMR
jgi:hypothetical protein